NAFRGRSVYTPMSSRRRPTGRYQLTMGPWYHLTAASHDFDPTMLAWFDHWLKAQNTGITHTRKPAHLYLLGANRFVNESRWPPPRLRPTTWFLGAGRTGSAPGSQNDGSLSRTRPAAKTGADQITWLPPDLNCSRELDQWSMGAFEDVAGPSNPDSGPCAQNDALTESGPASLTYTTTSFKRASVIGGPVDATVYASSTRPQTELVGTLEDVAPNGTSTPITTGALLGSLRSVDPGRSWRTVGGRYLLPYHPYTVGSGQPVPVGRVTRFDIEIRPTFAEIAAGHRLRLTITTSDLPTLVPPESDVPNLLGGIYSVQRNARSASYLEVLSSSASKLGLPAHR
ncbi:MAG TPA: CocE/NonD family hydrolase, partial [Solirubrobacteraceae bacterium]|nr:CocE/NonD family hydrolase [Solirubrobacteraceae bacterium]